MKYVCSIQGVSSLGVAVVPWPGTPRFWQISKPISARGGRLCPPKDTAFSYLPMALVLAWKSRNLSSFLKYYETIHNLWDILMQIKPTFTYLTKKDRILPCFVFKVLFLNRFRKVKSLICILILVYSLNVKCRLIEDKSAECAVPLIVNWIKTLNFSAPIHQVLFHFNYLALVQLITNIDYVDWYM